MSAEKVALIIRDGWGYREDPKDNAIAEARTPYTDKLMAEYPHVLVEAAGEAVGLPKGYQGNSEVGHMTLGSGRIIMQSMVRINNAVDDKSFYEIPELVKACDNAKGKTLHLMGLLQVEGVHAHINHLFALLELAKNRGVEDVAVHVFTDGRDAPVTDSIKHVKALQEKMGELGVGYVASVSGRFYAMDRDTRWERTEKAYRCVVEGKAEDTFTDALEKIRQRHEAGETDEFIKPVKHEGYDGMVDGDQVVFYNFRTDRTRQLTKALVEKDFDGFERTPQEVGFVAMTQYYKPMNAEVAFRDQALDNLLGKVVSDAGLTQLRISETEKYAHVTFFFNGQVEQPYPGEERVLIESPKVKTYDLKPEMSVYEIRDRLVEELGNGYDLIVTNLVNCDMVGHTGDTDAIHKAVESVDECLKDIVEKALSEGYTVLVVADHGNAEDQRPQWRTSHTVNPVPFIVVSEEDLKLKEGMGLKDVAPTIVDLLGLEKPKEMSGQTIIE